ncbi:hypothetical protein V8G54_014721 [Vigna mungo]|uniref:Uncharacterized protein n=1 Tax=Vigna mungo TaxID=3915 RepID=A0AAQ3NJL4_VIGMU
MLFVVCEKEKGKEKTLERGRRDVVGIWQSRAWQKRLPKRREENNIELKREKREGDLEDRRDHPRHSPFNHKHHQGQPEEGRRSPEALGCQHRVKLREVSQPCLRLTHSNSPVNRVYGISFCMWICSAKCILSLLLGPTRKTHCIIHL